MGYREISVRQLRQEIEPSKLVGRRFTIKEPTSDPPESSQVWKILELTNKVLKAESLGEHIFGLILLDRSIIYLLEDELPVPEGG